MMEVVEAVAHSTMIAKISTTTINNTDVKTIITTAIVRMVVAMEIAIPVEEAWLV